MSDSRQSSGLAAIGWDERDHDGAVGRPARVLVQHPYIVTVDDGRSVFDSEFSGPIRARARKGDQPTVGDWVLVDDNQQVAHLFERKSAIFRVHPRKGRPQCIAANVDRVAIVIGADQSLSEGQIERFVAAVVLGGAEPVLVWNKADLVPFPPAILRDFSARSGTPILAVSALSGEGVPELKKALGPGTVLFFGVSGAGKSSLVNALFGIELLSTGDVRARDATGRHTTSVRTLWPLPGEGLCLIDVPGIRDLVPWGDVGDLRQVYPEIAEAAAQCRFRDCSHGTEPGCALDGFADRERLLRYRRLVQEMAETGGP